MGMRKLLLILTILLSLYSSGQSPMFKLIAKKAAACTPDADAQAFIDSVGITVQSEKDAICNLVSQLKSNSLWAKGIAIYPLSGTSATSQKWNLKDPRDVNAAYRITWSGTLTHNSSGVKPSSGGKGLFNLAYNSIDIDSFSIAAYITENASSAYGSVGVAANISELYSPFPGGNIYLWKHGNNLVSTNGATGSGDARGFYLGNSSSAGTSAWYNGSSKSSQSTVATSTATTTSYSINPASSFTNTIGLVWMGWGLTNSEISTLNTIIETYMDAIGRGYQ